MKKQAALLLALILLLGAATGFAAVPEPPPADTPYSVFDYAGVCGEADLAAMERYASLLRTRAGSVAVCVVVEGLGGMEAEAFALELFDSWQIGSCGALLLLAVEDREIYMATGTEMEEVLSAEAIDFLLDQGIEELSAGEYSAGLRWIFTETCSWMANAAGVSLAPIDPPSADTPYYVFDYAGVMTSKDLATMEEHASALDANTQSLAVCVVVNSLEGLAIEDYAMDLFNGWRIGARGVLLLLAVEDREVYIATGVDREEMLPPAAIDQLLELGIEKLTDNDFSAGLCTSFCETCDYLTQEEEKAIREADPAPGPRGLERKPKQQPPLKNDSTDQ